MHAIHATSFSIGSGGSKSKRGGDARSKRQRTLRFAENESELEPEDDLDAKDMKAKALKEALPPSHLFQDMAEE